jgi:hypothetical protein
MLHPASDICRRMKSETSCCTMSTELMVHITLTILFSTSAAYRSLIATSKLDAPGLPAWLLTTHSGLHGSFAQPGRPAVRHESL